MRQRKQCLYDVIRSCNCVAGIITVVGGSLYASVRLILLSLAFCALRYVPEGVYTTSWTTFLPNISSFLKINQKRLNLFDFPVKSSIYKEEIRNGLLDSARKNGIQHDGLERGTGKRYSTRP
jgi:hypothetical protein